MKHRSILVVIFILAASYSYSDKQQEVLSKYIKYEKILFNTINKEHKLIIKVEYPKFSNTKTNLDNLNLGVSKLNEGKPSVKYIFPVRRSAFTFGS